MTQREASHAGSWYSDHGPTLSSQLSTWLRQVDPTVTPQLGARVIIAPHAGYSYSGPAAAWAYKSLDLSKAKRIFLLGPSHHIYLPNCALSSMTHYLTPLGTLALDLSTIASLRSTSSFAALSSSADTDEHSLELHLPYIHHLLSTHFTSPKDFPPLTPILIGSLTPTLERQYGSILAPYLADPTSIFIISSDFCHWGRRFNYTYYMPSSATDAADGYSLKARDKPPSDPSIHESIARIDKLAMEAVESGEQKALVRNLQETGNTVCGRHPIGVVMAAMEVLKAETEAEVKGEREAKFVENKNGRFQFVRYERSSDCKDVSDSSVSYASAFAVL